MTTRKRKSVLRVLVADAHPVTVAGVVAALAEEPDLEVIGTVANADDLMDSVHEHEPDVAVVDLQMWGLEGLEDIADLRQAGVRTRFLLLTDQSIDGSIGEALNLGANGLICKSEPLPVISEGIRTVFRGRSFLSSAAQTALCEELRQTRSGIEDRVAAQVAYRLLTDRELDILRLTARGRSIAAIGRQLHMSASTVKNHRQHLYAKLDVPNAPAAVHQAMRRGLLE